MQQELKTQIANGISEYAQSKGLTNNDIARLTGVNAGYISNILRHQFTNEVNNKDVLIGDKHFHKLAQWAGLETKKTYWHMEPTVQFTEIVSTLEDCKTECKTALLIANTGLGKTNAIDVFCKKNPLNTYRITVNSLYKLVDVINDLGDLIGIEATTIYGKRMHTYSLKNRMDKIAAKLIEQKQTGGEPILIIDEGENMEISVLKMTKGLFDIVKGHCGIVLVGTPKLLNNMLNSNGRNRTSSPELYRRFKAGLKTISPINKKRDFKPFFDRYVKDKGLQKLISMLAENYGELYDYLQPTLKECDEKGIELSEDFFRIKWNEQRFQNN